MVISDVQDEARQPTIDNNVVGSVDSLISLIAKIHTNGEINLDSRRRIMIAETP